jgi:hypothetical protein
MRLSVDTVSWWGFRLFTDTDLSDLTDLPEFRVTAVCPVQLKDLNGKTGSRGQQKS